MNKFVFSNMNDLFQKDYAIYETHWKVCTYFCILSAYKLNHFKYVKFDM